MDIARTITPAPDLTIAIKCVMTTSGVSTSITATKSGRAVLVDSPWYIACTKFSPAVLAVITKAVDEAKAEANGTTVAQITANQSSVDSCDRSYDAITKAMSI